MRTCACMCLCICTMCMHVCIPVYACIYLCTCMPVRMYTCNQKPKTHIELKVRGTRPFSISYRYRYTGYSKGREPR